MRQGLPRLACKVTPTAPRDKVRQLHDSCGVELRRMTRAGVGRQPVHEQEQVGGQLCGPSARGEGCAAHLLCCCPLPAHVRTPRMTSPAAPCPNHSSNLHIITG